MKLKDLTKISPEARRKVYERDSFSGRACCVICGKPQVQVAHIIGRGQGGLGIPENLICLCIEHHQMLDNGNDTAMSEAIRRACEDYLRNSYPGWDESKLVAKKGL